MAEDDNKHTSLSYSGAGVDIDAGEELVRRIKPFAAMTRRAGADASLGGFGGAFDLAACGYRDPILISGTDGVGTKLKVAIETGRHDGIGIDLVAMCVNDVLAQGALPLFFLDYFACSRLDVDVAAKVVESIAKGCKESGCALIGGETAEMPGMYAEGHYDLAGFCVGAVERDEILPRLGDMKAGDVLIGLKSSGLHSNGYSLARKVVARSGLSWADAAPFSNDHSLADALLEPTRLYPKRLAPLFKAGVLKGAAHITGGGLVENPPRMLPESLVPRISDAAIPFGPLFDWLKEVGAIEPHEMQRTFNCGVGMILCVGVEDVDRAMTLLGDGPDAPFIIGDLA
jgi:phosphoribosylformylglycinamidine cyclo-ligase